MESENHRLRRQVADLQYENTYMRKITEMQAEIISLRKQVSDLEKENKRLNQLISTSSKTSKHCEELSSDEEYYTADEGPDNLFDRTCMYCGKMFKYPSRLKEHFIRNNKCAKKVV
jgi:hypothetical protein